MKDDIGNSWGKDFPLVMHFIDQSNVYAKPWVLLTDHPDYDAAKNHEDREAAARLVENLLSTPENRAQLKSLKDKYPDAVIVPVHALEAKGKNRLPEALAEYIGQRTGLEVDAGIVQTNEVHRTGTDAWHRFAFRPKFGGEVKKGRKYILVDDVFSNGGSFSELKRHIERNGGEVVQTAALSLGGHGDDIAMLPAMRDRLLDKYGGDTLNLFLEDMKLYEGNYKHLTQPEAYALGKASSLDDVRDRIIEARQEGRARILSEAVRERDAAQIEQKPGRSRRR
jgi:hypothetical protein